MELSRRSFFKRLGLLVGALAVAPSALLALPKKVEANWKTMPSKIRFRRYKSFPPVTAPLAEGIVPTREKLTFEEIWYDTEMMNKAWVKRLEIATAKIGG